MEGKICQKIQKTLESQDNRVNSDCPEILTSNIRGKSLFLR